MGGTMNKNPILNSIKWKSEPYIYQGQAITNAVKGLVKDRFFGYFMEMGTGKTKSTLNTAEILHARKYIQAIIILAPKPLMAVWEDEIEKHTFLNTSILLWSSHKCTSKTYQKELSDLFKNKNKKVPVFIINVEAFQTKNDTLIKILGQFKDIRTLVALDESTKIKNPKANRTQRMIDLFDHENFFKMILTGTEVTNSLLDLYSQFEFLKKGFWKMRNYYAFQARYAMIIEKKTLEGHRYKQVVGFRRTQELQNKIDKHIFRALSDECLDLPEKIQTDIKVEMNKDQKRVYKELRDNLFVEYNDEELTATIKMVLITYFRQIVGGFFPGTTDMIGENNPKFDALYEDSLEYSGKVVVFASFVNEIIFITEELNRRYKMEVAVPYYGDVKHDEREENQRRFKDLNSGIKFIVINPSTGAFGLNLQVSNLMYWYGRPTSPEENWQGDKRIHRIGQTKHCIYKDIKMKGSVDTKLMTMLLSKTKLKNGFQLNTLADIYEMV